MREKIKELIEEKISEDTVKCVLRNFIEVYINPGDKFNKVRWRTVQKVMKNNSDLFVENFSWNHFCYSISITGDMECGFIYNYFMYLIDNRYYKENNRFVYENINNIKCAKGDVFKKIFYVGCKPEFLYVTNAKGIKTRYNLNCDNVFLREVLVAFIEEGISDKTRGNTRNKEFIYHFERSLYAVDNKIESIYDFNYDTFSKQYRYYKKINLGSHKAVSILVSFYLYLYSYIKKLGIVHEFFSIKDGIDKNYLLKSNFSNLYDSGFKVVYYNIYDEIPKFDRWVVAPNGEEIRSISKKGHEYSPIDFSRIYNEKLKRVLKHWYWKSTNNLFGKDKTYYSLVKFIQYLINRMKIEKESKVININRDKIRKYDIMASDIIEYRLSIINRYESNSSKTSIISSIKELLDHSQSYELLTIEASVFSYLRGFAKEETTPNPIIKEDLNLIVSYFKEKEKTGGLLDKLYFAITYLCLTTNLRISEVLGLERNCLVETMKSGQFAIRYLNDNEKGSEANLSLLRKGGSGSYREENISKYTERVIREAISITQEASLIADDEVGKYIFLIYNSKNGVSTILKDRYYRDFRKVIKSLPLKKHDYTVYDMRDTFMTGIYTEGKKRGIDFDKIHIATGHKDPTTTIKAYRNTEIRDYLEAFYGIIIGDIELKGEVVESIEGKVHYKESINEVTVSNECGFCKNNGCGEIFKVDCLVCKSFITTVDRIEHFEKRINILDKMISTSMIEHDKEHMLKIKKLLLGYLEKLYIVKEGMEQDVK